MTEAERTVAIRQMIKDYTAKHSVSKEAARAVLISEGFHYENGDLRPEYGGKSARKTRAA
jgi:hypothetical protein